MSPSQPRSPSEVLKAWEERGTAIFEREPIDPIWAVQAETELNGYLAENQAIINKYGVPAIRCRTTGCVATFVSYDPALAAAVIETGIFGQPFSDDNEGCFESSWGQEFTSQIGIVATSYVDNGVVRTLWLIGKKEQQTNTIESAQASLQ